MFAFNKTKYAAKHVVSWTCVSIAFVFLLAGCQTQKIEKLECQKDMGIDHSVIVSNISETPLICFKANYGADDWALTTEVQIGPKSSKKIKMCSYEDYLACQLITDAQSSTFLTYFKPYLAGEYKVTLQDVPCDKCESSKTRQGAVVELPNGEKIYKWRQ